jgi:hypothetical protein
MLSIFQMYTFTQTIRLYSARFTHKPIPVSISLHNICPILLFYITFSLYVLIRNFIKNVLQASELKEYRTPHV